VPQPCRSRAAACRSLPQPCGSPAEALPQPCRSPAAALPQPCRSPVAAVPDVLEAQGSLPRPGAPLVVSRAHEYHGHTGDQTPLKLAAKCRDARVPYTFPFSTLTLALALALALALTLTLTLTLTRCRTPSPSLL
jgi:hypothetical protein